MASLCSKRLSTNERFKIRQDLDCWSSKFIHNVGLEKILELLLGTQVLEDLGRLTDPKPSASKWSFDESCLFCRLRREKVKDHVMALTKQIVESGGKPLLGKDPSNISRLERQSEEFLSAVLHRKEYTPRIPDPHIPVVACRVMKQMLEELASCYASGRRSSPHYSQSCRDIELSPVKAGEGSLSFMVDQDTPLDLSVKKTKVEDIQQDGVLDLSTKKNLNNGLVLLRNSPAPISPPAQRVQRDSPDQSLSRAPDHLSSSTSNQLVSKLCLHHQLQIIEALGFFQSEIKTQFPSKHFQSIQPDVCQKPHSDGSESRSQMPHVNEAKTQETSIVRSLLEPSGETSTAEASSMSCAIIETTDFCNTEPSLISSIEKSDEQGSPPENTSSKSKTSPDHQETTGPLDSSIKLGDPLKKCECSTEPCVKTCRAGSNRAVHAVFSQTASFAQNTDTILNPATQRNSNTVDVITSPRTARKSRKGSRNGLLNCVANDPDSHCDLVYINKSIIESQANARNRLQPRKNARKSTRGHRYIEEYLELKTIRTLARQSRGNCPPHLIDMHSLVTLKRGVCNSGSVPAVNTPNTGDCMKSVMQQLSSAQDETPGDVVKVAEISLTAETSQTGKTDSNLQICQESLREKETDSPPEAAFTESRSQSSWESLCEDANQHISHYTPPSKSHKPPESNVPHEPCQETLEENHLKKVKESSEDDSLCEPLAVIESESKPEDKNGPSVNPRPNHIETESFVGGDGIEKSKEMQTSSVESEIAIHELLEQAEVQANLKEDVGVQELVEESCHQTMSSDKLPEHEDVGCKVEEGSVLLLGVSKKFLGPGTPKSLKARCVESSDRRLRSRVKGKAEELKDAVRHGVSELEAEEKHESKACTNLDADTAPNSKREAVVQKKESAKTPKRKESKSVLSSKQISENEPSTNKESRKWVLSNQTADGLETEGKTRLTDEESLNGSESKSSPVRSKSRTEAVLPENGQPLTPKRTESLSVLSQEELPETGNKAITADSQQLKLAEQCAESSEKGIKDNGFENECSMNRSSLMESENYLICNQNTTAVTNSPVDTTPVEAMSETTQVGALSSLLESTPVETTPVEAKSSSNANKSTPVGAKDSIAGASLVGAKSSPTANKKTPVGVKNSPVETVLLETKRRPVANKTAPAGVKVGPVETTLAGGKCRQVTSKTTPVGAKGSSAETTPVRNKRRQATYKTAWVEPKTTPVETPRESKTSSIETTIVGAKTSLSANKRNPVGAKGSPTAVQRSSVRCKDGSGKTTPVGAKCSQAEIPVVGTIFSPVDITQVESNTRSDETTLIADESSLDANTRTLVKAKNIQVANICSRVEAREDLPENKNIQIRPKSSPGDNKRGPIGSRCWSTGNKRSFNELSIGGDSVSLKNSPASSEIMVLRSRSNTELSSTNGEPISTPEGMTRSPLHSRNNPINKTGMAGDSLRRETVESRKAEVSGHMPLRSSASGAIQPKDQTATVEIPGRKSLRSNVSNMESPNSSGSPQSRCKNQSKLNQVSASLSSDFEDILVSSKAKIAIKKSPGATCDDSRHIARLQRNQPVICNKFLEALMAEEHQQLIASSNARFEKINKGWVPMDREVQPAPKPKNKADRLKEIWKSKRRVRKLRPSEQQRFSPVQMLFMKPFDLPSICEWFLQSTETKSLVIVKKVNTRLPSETQLCFHNSSASADGIFPSLQAERLKKHLKKFAIASPFKNNAKNQRLLSKALAQSFNMMKRTEKHEPTSAARICTKAQSLTTAGPTPAPESLNVITKNPASARILRKYSNMREKLQVQQNTKCKKTQINPTKGSKDKLQTHKKAEAVAVPKISAKANSSMKEEVDAMKGKDAGAMKRLEKLKTVTKTIGKRASLNMLSKKMTKSKKIKVSTRKNESKLQRNPAGPDLSLVLENKAVTVEDQVLTRSQRKMEFCSSAHLSPKPPTKRGLECLDAPAKRTRTSKP